MHTTSVVTTITTTVTPAPPLACPPGTLQFNSTLCVPCPAGWSCLYGAPAPCAPGAWSAHGQSACRPCAACPNGTLTLIPCGGPAEGQCHTCLPGFERAGSACMPSSAAAATSGQGWAFLLDPSIAGGVLLILLLEIAVCALCFWRVNADDEPRAPRGHHRARHAVPARWIARLIAAGGGGAGWGARGADGQGRGTGLEPYQPVSTNHCQSAADKELLRACSWYDPRRKKETISAAAAGDEASVGLLVNHPARGNGRPSQCAPAHDAEAVGNL